MDMIITCVVGEPEKSARTKLDNALLQFGLKTERALRESSLFRIQLKQMPDILDEVEKAGYFAESGERIWRLHQVSDRGIILFVDHIAAGEGTVFIPFDNIIAISNIDESFTEDIRRYNEEKNVGGGDTT